MEVSSAGVVASGWMTCAVGAVVWRGEGRRERRCRRGGAARGAGRGARRRIWTRARRLRKLTLQSPGARRARGAAAAPLAPRPCAACALRRGAHRHPPRRRRTCPSCPSLLLPDGRSAAWWHRGAARNGDARVLTGEQFTRAAGAAGCSFDLPAEMNPQRRVGFYDRIAAAAGPCSAFSAPPRPPPRPPSLCALNAQFARQSEPPFSTLTRRPSQAPRAWRAATAAAQIGADAPISRRPSSAPARAPTPRACPARAPPFLSSPLSERRGYSAPPATSLLVFLKRAARAPRPRP